MKYNSIFKHLLKKTTTGRVRVVALLDVPRRPL